MNVKVNAEGLKDAEAAAAWRRALESLEAQAAEAETRLQRALDARLGPAPR
jgi:formiminotetrahydrofolate cyclodeaminase